MKLFFEDLNLISLLKLEIRTFNLIRLNTKNCIAFKHKMLLSFLNKHAHKITEQNQYMDFTVFMCVCYVFILKNIFIRFFCLNTPISKRFITSNSSTFNDRDTFVVSLLISVLPSL